MDLFPKLDEKKTGVTNNLQSDQEEIQVVTAALLQLVFLPVDDNGGDLLVHEDEDGGEKRG